MTTASATLPDALGDAAREFVSGPHRLLIGAERPEAADGRTFVTLDPATGQEIAQVAHGGPEDAARAVAAARAAFEGPWSELPAAGRERLLHDLALAVESHAQELAEIESLDNGKPVGLAQYVDVRGTAAHLRYFAGWPTKIEGGVLPVTAPNMHCYTRREPVGGLVVLAVGRGHDCPLDSQASHDGSAESACASRDHGDASAHLSHPVAPPCVRNAAEPLRVARGCRSSETPRRARARNRPVQRIRGGG